MVPPIGARFTCTSNTDMKIDTRVTGSAPSAPCPISSRGGGTVAIIVTSPSAGAADAAGAAGRGPDRSAEEGQHPDRQPDAEPAEHIGQQPEHHQCRDGSDRGELVAFGVDGGKAP